ncbi:MAG: type II secretion system protein [Gammaproteobacteria bacterium]|nr:type II secretion system protein [Gammaproteobacteria bacterium]
MFLNPIVTDTDSSTMYKPGGPAHPKNDDGFTLVELLIVIVILGILATVTVFAVRGITNQGEDNATAIDRRTLTSAEEAHMAKFGTYVSEAELVSAGLLREQSSLHDITVGPGDTYTVVAQGAGGGGGTASLGTATVWGGVPALEYGTDTGGGTFVVIGGAVAGPEWDALVAANTDTVGKRMIFVDAAGITSVLLAEEVHLESLPMPRVWSLADDVANFSGPQSLSLFMETFLPGGPHTYTKINDGSGRDVAWAFDW